MNDRLLPLVHQALSGGKKLTLEALHAAIAAHDPVAVVRGTDWFARWLVRAPGVTVVAGSYALVEDGEDEAEGHQAEAVDRPEVDRSIPRRYVIFDLETNADRGDEREHEIIEIAALRVVDGRAEDRFSTLVRPERRLTDDVIQLTGLHDGDLVDAPELAAALADFVEFLGDDPVIAHNGFGYDFLVLDAACASCEIPVAPGVRLDTLELAHLVFPRAGEELTADIDGTNPPRGRRLEDLAYHLGVTVADGLHRALADVKLLTAVLHELLLVFTSKQPRLRLARWVLEQCGHPWAAFGDPINGPPDLVDVVPLPESPDCPAPTYAFSPGDVVALFEPGGALLGSARSHRPQQVRMVGEVANALADGSKLLIEAPTGTGKTLAYLAPAVAYSRAIGAPVVIATHSKVLQNQILTAMTQLGSAFGSVRTVLLKGRENYVSVESLDGVLDEPPLDVDLGLALAVVCSWVGVTPTGEWDDLRVWALSWNRGFARLQWELRVEAEGGIAYDELEGRCFYRRAKEGLADAEIAVLNHAVVVSRQDWREECAHLILDEAHNLEEAATGALTDEVTEDVIHQVLRAVYDRGARWGTLARWCDATGTSLRCEEAQAVKEAVRAAEAAASALTDALVEFLRTRAGARRAEIERFGISLRLVEFERRRAGFGPVRTAAGALGRALRAVADQLDMLTIPDVLRRRYRRRRLEQEFARAGRRLRESASLVYEVAVGVAEGNEHRADLWIDVADLRLEDDRFTWGLRQVPLTVAPLLNDLWSELEAAVLTSATLQVRGSFSYVQKRLGLEYARTAVVPTPFERLHEQQLIVLTDHLPAPTGNLIDAFTIAQTDELARLFTLTHGRAMALFAARSRMLHARDHVRPLMENRRVPVLCQGDAPAPALVEEMRARLATSLLATRSFWEGVDIPGEFLSLLIIEKLPFDSPGDPIVAARIELIERRGEDPFDEYLVPMAAIRFAQGVGRLIRTHEDVGVVVVLDKRLRRPVPYRDAFLSVLSGDPTIARPLSANEAYSRIAQHLCLPWDESIRAELAALPTSDPWAFLNELQLDDDQARDTEVVERVLDEIRKRLGFETWRAGQLDVMSRLIAGDDVVAILPTGAGKSITYQIPALLRPGVTLVVSPLIALMRDQVRRLRERGILGVGALHAGMSQSEQEEVLASARSGSVRLLYVSPERLWAKRFRSALRNLNVARVVVDEAHCVSQWGHSFRPEYAEIANAIRQIVGDSERRPTTAAMTATATGDVQREICASLEIDLADPVVRHPDRPELRYQVVDCDNREDRDLMVVRIVEAFRDQAVIVYVPRQRDTMRLAGLLRAANHRARPYHGGMESEQRLHVEEAFVDNEIAVVVATKAFGLGIDKQDVAAVVHLEMPASVEEYIQETGRAARGAIEGYQPSVGVCVLLRTPRDCSIHRMFVRGSAPDVDLLHEVWDAVGPSWTGPLSQLLDGKGEDEVSLAASYLVRARALSRGEDLAWEGRVFVPRDARETLASLGSTDGHLLEIGERVLGAAERLGTDEYHARRWAEATGLHVTELEEAVLELSRRGVVGFVNWEFAWQLERTAVEPDWGSLRITLDDRRQKIERLSDTAKTYRSQDQQCRRAWLLWYLDADPDLECDNCDVCHPELPRPWEKVEITAATLIESVPYRFLILALVADTEPYGFSRTTVEMVLAGADLQYNRHLADGPLYGALSTMGPNKIRATIDAAIAEGAIEEVEVRRGTATYPALRLTDEGRRQLS